MIRFIISITISLINQKRWGYACLLFCVNQFKDTIRIQKCFHSLQLYDTMTLTDFIAHASMKNVAFSVYIVINSNLAGVAPLDITHPRMRKIEEG